MTPDVSGATSQLFLPRSIHEDQNNGTKMDSLKLASVNTDFAFSLYRELVLKNPNKNILFSPFSISAALAILSLGASSNTLEEILEGLKFNLTETPEANIHRGFGHLLHTLSQPGDQINISIGSMMFVEKRLQILAEFKEKARALYQSEVSMTDFQQPDEAKKLINDYVRKQTQQKIKELMSELDECTVMVLVNYIYFKGKWNTSFDPEDTFESEFHLGNNRSVKVPMMHIEDLTTPYFQDEDLSCSVVELKYIGNASALFILPDEGRMQQVEASLPCLISHPEQRLGNTRGGAHCRNKPLHQQPRPAVDASFRNLLSCPPWSPVSDVFLLQVVHKAVLDVAETGTEAAAATGVKFTLRSAILDPFILSFDRPFLMIIFDTNTQTLLFLAKITNPKRG
uniref:Serpin domain-containing protein n=1 Tax=Peromyscus maniculatus bairdii TaxID=230844 RepID=A0A8C8UDI5_PERMB